ncbi:AraC family transcriptional regulator [Sphingobacterium athyrii]|uniref:HTH araC/xylS-type domain-containing protein n=1 Tax=Sphingobacterium athyrii TaxID=2152717 RepID=A0A363NTE4_9SPHI|nr:response regulator transcription factor [Sphingobacterium athyrii]PUV23998.1 hypothetical protein DCO56_11515 [Sphingobacterium athyrii]
MDIYTINNIVLYRKLDWTLSDDFFYLTHIPTAFEPFTIHPNYYSFGIIHQGSMKIEIDSQQYNIVPGSFLIYRPEQTLKIVEIEVETEGAFILFTRRFIQNFQPSFDAFFTKTFLHKNFDSHFMIDKNDHDQLSTMFGKIFDVLSSIYTDRWEISARSVIYALINETDLILKKYKNFLNPTSKKESLVINKFKLLAKENFSNRLPITFYVDKLNLSASQLYKIFKRKGHISPSSYLNELLLQEAKFLLSDSENNIGEIADKLSFSDIHTFSTYFKKQTGLSPSAFRSREFDRTQKDKK